MRTIILLLAAGLPLLAQFEIYTKQLITRQDTVDVQVGITAPGSVTGIQLRPSAGVGSGDQVNIGINFINALKPGGIGHNTIWALGSDGAFDMGELQVSDGTGAGGWDGNGAQMRALAVTGIFETVALKMGSTTGGNQVNAGLDFINALKNGVAGNTIWALGQSGNTGVLRLSNSLGVGGFDGNGAEILASGGSGLLSAVNLLVGSFPSGGHQVNVGLDFINSLKNGVAGDTMWAFGQSSGKGVLRISDGSGSGGWDSNGAQVYADATSGVIKSTIGLFGSSSGGDQINLGGDFINSLKNGTAGDTIWALAQSGNKGILRLSDGSGAGGFDGNGAWLYGDGTTSTLSTVNLTFSGILKFAVTSFGSGVTATLGTNSPATVTTPYHWYPVKCNDGTSCFIPVWK